MIGNQANGRPGTVSRRGVLRGATALGTAALFPLGAGRAAAQPKQGGTLRLAMAHGSTTDTLDPAVLENAFQQLFATARNGYMTEIAADGTLVGDIAESWEASPDARVWTFKLRDGVTFHSGKPVTAEDVIASLDYHRGEESTSAAKPIVAPIAEMAADGANVVVVTLESGSADFPFVISDYHLPILPAVDGKIDPLSPDGCGGYVVDSYEPGVRATMSRNPNYWKLPERAHFDAVEILTIIDAAARQNALVTGEVDVIDQVDVNTVHLLQRAPGVEILSTTGTQHFTFAMDTRAAPFSDNNVRLALKYAIDRQELVDKVLNGYGALGNDQPVGPSDRFYADLEQRTYDPDKARFHLKEAGLDSSAGLALGGGRGVSRRGGRGAALFGAGGQGRHHDRRGARAQRRLLVECLDGQALRGGLLERPADAGLDVLDGLCRRASPGTTRSGTTSASTCCSRRRARNSTRRSAPRCIARCSFWCATRVAW